ncbi:glycosyltransferase [Alienimonas sp. DA493]|uniref:glycosyltransferase family protein n=1 Tax=Alienimonas sp. DA493 TaxID=3373605 RepID=UPI0037551E71
MSPGRLARRLLAPARRWQLARRGDALAAGHRPVAGDPPPGPGAGGTVVLDLRERPLDRYPYSLGRLLFEGGYRVHLRVRSERFGRGDKYGRELLALPGLTVETTRRGRPAGVPDGDPARILWITEDPAADVPDRPFRAVIRLRYDWAAAPAGALVLPFPLHPDHYRPAPQSRPLDDLAALRARDRTVGALFAGAADPGVYGSGPIRETFHLVPRAALLAALEGRPHAPSPLPPAESGNARSALHAALRRQGGTTRDRFVRPDGWKIGADEWLASLAEADFFLAPPGYRIPFSHNLTEALAVGTVPITNYGHLMRPALTDREALLFNTPEQLTERLREALAMPVDQRRAMGRAAAAYYDAHLAPAAFAGRLERLIETAEATPPTLYLVTHDLPPGPVPAPPDGRPA